jgi:hypothetical protein
VSGWLGEWGDAVMCLNFVLEDILERFNDLFGMSL